MRLSVSSSYWPVAWPSRFPATLTLETGRSALMIPVRPSRPEDASLHPFGDPEGAPVSPTLELGDVPTERTVRRDLVTGETVYTMAWDLDDAQEPVLTRVEEINLETGFGVRQSFRIREGDPLSSRAEILHRCHLRRGDWSIRVMNRLKLSGTIESFRIEAVLVATENGREVARRRWDTIIPREGV